MDELRAAGALDVLANWRESLHVERDLFLNFVDDEGDQETSSVDQAEDDDDGSGGGPVSARFAG